MADCENCMIEKATYSRVLIGTGQYMDLCDQCAQELAGCCDGKPVGEDDSPSMDSTEAKSAEPADLSIESKPHQQTFPFMDDNDTQ